MTEAQGSIPCYGSDERFNLLTFRVFIFSDKTVHDIRGRFVAVDKDKPTVKSDTKLSNAAPVDEVPGKARADELEGNVVETGTNSSGINADPLHDRVDRYHADAALEPGLAREFEAKVHKETTTDVRGNPTEV